MVEIRKIKIIIIALYFRMGQKENLIRTVKAQSDHEDFHSVCKEGLWGTG